MSSFRLEFDIPRFEHKLNIRQKMLSLGSCFAEEIGSSFRSLKFNIAVNPHGIIYNAASIASVIDRYVSGKEYETGELGSRNGLWYSFDHHGKFNHSSSEECLESINTSFRKGCQYIRNADWLIITIGTGYGWYVRSSGKIAANCHRLPASEFNKRLIPSTSASGLLARSFESAFRLNPELKVILTLSPVRYIRDGVTENALGKAHSLTAIHELCRKFENVFYFPAYELVTDDLRDYRFFKEDRVHPTAEATAYVFEKFIKSVCDDETLDAISRIKEIKRGMEHRPRRPDDPEFHNFLKVMSDKLKSVKEIYPFLDLSEETSYFSQDRKR